MTTNDRRFLSGTLTTLIVSALLLAGCEEEPTFIGMDRLDAGRGDDDDDMAGDDDDDMAGDDDDDMAGDDDDDDDACGPGLACGADEFCDVDPETCGGRTGTGTCEPRPEACPEDCPGVCGCDGLDYCNACTAQAAGIDASNSTACLARGDVCDPQRIRVPDPACDLFLGYAWDGRGCVSVSGCACAGADCDEIFRDEASCLAAFDECIDDDPCEALDARGEGDCDAILGVTWNGRECVEISGCRCVGADCAVAERLNLMTCAALYGRCTFIP